MKNLILFLILSLLFASCASKRPLTSELYSRLSEEQIKHVQFYNSEDIVLIKQKQVDNTFVNNGKVILLDDDKTEKVIIKRNTKCVISKKINDNQSTFCFEFGDGKKLLFGTTNNGPYYLMAENWKEGVGTLQYANKTYTTESGSVSLLVKMKHLRKLEKRYRVAKGVKVN